MSARLAILCPGQGAQHAQMFDLIDAEHRAALFSEWQLEKHLGMPVAAALADDAALFSNRIAQPLIVAAEMAMWSALRDALPAPAVVAGYSIGELSAYGVAGSLGAADAVALAATRARLMDECAADGGTQAMLAVPHLDGGRVRELIADHRLFIAIETAEDSVIVGGANDEALALQGRIRGYGERACMLPVGVASHTPLMQAAAERFGEELRTCRFADPRTPVVAGISAQLVYRKEDALSSLASQIAETIRWMDCMDACAEAGVTVALELGPGTALSRMLRSRHPHIECRSVAEFRALSSIESWVARHF